jgi:hypothetical protein
MRTLDTLWPIPTYAVITVALAGFAIATYFAYGLLVLQTALVAEGG